MEVSGQDGLDGAFLATGYPFRALPTLDLYLAIFRDVFQHAKAIRRCGSAALDLAYTAAGVYDGFFEFRLSPWDIGAGILLVRRPAAWSPTSTAASASSRAATSWPAARPCSASCSPIVRRHASEAAIERLNPPLRREPVSP